MPTHLREVYVLPYNLIAIEKHCRCLKSPRQRNSVYLTVLLNDMALADSSIILSILSAIIPEIEMDLDQIPSLRKNPPAFTIMYFGCWNIPDVKFLVPGDVGLC